VVLKHPAFTTEKGVVSTKLKFVTSKFKERHATKQGKVDRTLTPDLFLEFIGGQFNTGPRFMKGV
jgi:hypothetical protein